MTPPEWLAVFSAGYFAGIGSAAFIWLAFGRGDRDEGTGD